MKIFSAIGGSGSSFIFRTLEKTCYSSQILRVDTYRYKVRLEKKPNIIPPLNLALKLAGQYRPNLKILMRPDKFWTDWKFNKTAIYNPSHPNLNQILSNHRSYLIKTRNLRTAGIKFSESDISTDSLPGLVSSYINKLQSVEAQSKYTIVLISGHWGEYGVYKELGVETIYVIRDPYNSLISHSKDIRHKKDYRRRGYEHINTRPWIDNYLFGPHHYWIKHAETALSHDNATIIRYHKFKEDWHKIAGLPDISIHFVYKENNINQILTNESISYINSRTHTICKELGFPTPII